MTGCINPCGMVMDVLRSCYSTQMQFSTGGPNVGVEWYWCPPGAKLFSSRHHFASLNWDKGNDNGIHTVGEVPGAARTWRNGSIPGPYPGDHPAGPLANFTSGCSGVPDLPWSGGMPTACAVVSPTSCWYLQGSWSHVSINWILGSDNAVSQYPTGSDYVKLFGPHSYRAFSFCNTADPSHPTGQNLEIQIDEPTGPKAFYGLANVIDLAHRKYTWHTTAGNPPGWFGGDVTLTLS